MLTDDEEIVAYFEDPNLKYPADRHIFMMAKFIETAYETIRGPCHYKRIVEGEEKWITMDECWNLLTIPQKRERLKQAKGAWDGIQFLGKENVIMEAINCYMAEK